MMRITIAAAATAFLLAHGFTNGPAQRPAAPAAPSRPAAQAHAADDAAPAGNAVKGKTIYVSYGCYECHNYAANGGAAGPRLAPKPIPFGEFSRYVRKPAGEMPPYTPKVVTDQELADIYAFLASMPEPAVAKPEPVR